MSLLPFYLPEKLDYIKNLNNKQLIIKALIDHSLEDVIIFFKAAIEDETYASKNLDVIKYLLVFFTKKSREKKLSRKELEALYRLIATYFSLLENVIPKDVAFIVQGEVFKSNSLIQQAVRWFVSEIIEQKLVEKQPLKIPLKGVLKEEFQYILTFIHTRDLPNLWKEEKETILRLIDIAVDWGLYDLERFCADIYKRYITKDNATKEYFEAVKRRSFALQKVCIEKVNQTIRGSDLKAKKDQEIFIHIDQISGDLEELKELFPYMKHLSFSKKVTEDFRFEELFKEFSQMKSLDLSSLPSFNQNLFFHLSCLESLNLENCIWVDDKVLETLSTYCPKIQKLILKRDESFTHKGISGFERLKTLFSLDLSYCMQIGDLELQMLAASCPNLLALNLYGCDQVTGKGLREIARECLHLETINLSYCQHINQEELIDIFLDMPYLKRMYLVNNLSVTENLLEQTLPYLGKLQEIDISKNNISKEFVNKLRKKVPYVNIID